MNRKRRDVLKGGALAAFGAGFFRRMDKIDGMQTPAGSSGGSLADIVKARGKGASEKMLLGPTSGEEGPPEPAKYDRLVARLEQADGGAVQSENGGAGYSRIHRARSAEHYLSDWVLAYAHGAAADGVHEWG